MKASAIQPDDVRRMVREELTRILARVLAVADEPQAYSSRRGHGPPGYAAREWRALAKRIGTKRGRWYVVTREALAAHEGASAQAVAVVPSKSTWTPATALAEAGLRVAHPFTSERIREVASNDVTKPGHNRTAQTRFREVGAVAGAR